GYTVTTVPAGGGNRTASSVWVAAADGKTPPRQLTNSGKKDRHARWSPDGKRLLFESNRSGDFQLWVIDLDGGEARQLTTISTEANNAIWSGDGKQIAFVSAVYPEHSEKQFKESDEANKKRKDENEKTPDKAKVITKLFYRHWDSYVEDLRQHLFVTSFDGEKCGEPKDVTPGDRDAFPTSDTFSSGDNFTFSPDGKYLIFTAVPEKNEAWSTNYDICRVPITGGTKEWECLTKDNEAADSGPQFSPDNRLYYRAQRRPGFEADRWGLTNTDADAKRKPFSMLPNFDHSIDSFTRAGTRELIYFTAENKASSPIYGINLK